MARGVLLLVYRGFSEKDVLDLPLDKFELYLSVASDLEKVERQKYVIDTAGAVGGLFSKKGVSEYLKKLDNPEE